MIAWIVGIFGAVLTYGLAAWAYHLSPGISALSVLVANISGFFALLATLTLERQAWARRLWLNRSLKTWSLFLVLGYGSFLALMPDFRHLGILSVMILPLALSNGLMIPLFGIVQDRIVRRIQLKAKAQAQARAEAQAQAKSKRSIPLFAR